MMKLKSRLLLLVLLFSFSISSNAQPMDAKTASVELRPYKLLNSARQITVSSKKNIKHIMLWTTGGNRVAEHKEINVASFTFDIPVNQKTFFFMVTLSDGKTYTEKIGIR